MKHFYIKYPRNFINEYALKWVEAFTTDEQDALRDGFSRISRKDAIDKCKAERFRRKADPQFSGYGASVILPWGYTEGQISLDNFVTKDGYVYELKE